jgi:DNA-binding response OmpR family regulator
MMQHSPTPDLPPLILLVEDDLDVSSMLEAMLAHLGFQPVCVEDGISAFEAVQRMPELACVMLDLHLPRKSGAEVLAALREVAPELPVVIMSGSTVETVASAYTGACRLVWLQKPFSFRELRQTLQQLLG